MARSLLRGSQFRDADVLSEAEHDVWVHKNTTLSGSLTLVDDTSINYDGDNDFNIKRNGTNRVTLTAAGVAKFVGRIGINEDPPSNHDILYLKSGSGSHCRLTLSSPGGYVPVIMFNYNGTDEASIQYRSDGEGLYFMVNGPSYPAYRRLGIESDGGIHTYNLKSGSDMSNAGAASTELWYTSNHPSLPDGIVMKGAGTDTDSGYIKKDGTTSLIGAWNYGSYTISGTGDIYCSDIYTSSGTVYIGDLQLSSDGIQLLVNGSPIEASSGGSTVSEGPVGSIVITVTSGVPDDYLECDGSAISRNDYSELFNVIGTMYGNGNGSTTFNLPDFRGQFIRGWDHGAGVDPDAASRTDRGDGTAGDNVGTKQDDEFESHRHGANETSAGAGGKIVSNDNSGHSDWFTEYAGGNETRPKNINVIFCIRYRSSESSEQTFLDLSDTPDSYSSTEGQSVVSTGSGIEFKTLYYYGTGDPPTASGLPEGTLYFKYSE